MSAVWVPVLASMKGFVAEVNKGAGQASKQAAQTLEKDLGQAGATGGKSAADALAKEMGVASSKVAAARKKEAGASSDLRVAEEQLAQLREKGNASTGQIMAAEAKVEDARRRQESMSDRLGAAERDLQAVRDGGEARASAVVTAENRVEDARLKAEKATDQVAVAEQKADDARQASESAASRVESAEKALAAAKEQAGEGSKEATSAERDLERARKDADSASVSVERAEGAVGRARADSKTQTEGLEVAELQLTAAQEKTARAAESAGDAAADAARDIGDLGDEMEGADPKASGLAGGLGSLAKNAGLAAAGFVGVRGIGDMISSGFDKVTAIEDTTASLGILMGSASDATAFMDEMTEANMKTPYSFDAWAEAGKNLVAFGMDADDVTDTVMALGEAASASGKGEQALSSMADAFGKAQASGKISMDTINSLAQGGVNGLTILGNHFGESTADMQKMISAGTVPLDEAFDALTTGIMEGSEGAAGSTDAMAGVMDEMSQTTSGQLGLLKMSFVNLGGDIVKLLMPAIQGLIDIGLDLVGWVRDMVSDFKEGEGVMGAFRDVIEKMMPVIKPLAAAIGAAGAAWLVWTGAIKAWQTVTKIATGIQVAFNAVMAANPVMLVVMAIAALVGGLVYFFTQTEKGKEVWDTLVDAFKTAWGWIKDTFGPIFEWVGDVATSAWDSIKSGWDALWQGIQTAWNSVLKPVFDMIWTVVSTTLGVIGTVILAPLLLAWEAMSAGIQAAWNNLIKPAWDAVASAAQWLWQNVLQPVFGFISDAWKRMVDLIKAAYDNVLKPAWDAVGNALKALWDSFVKPVIDWISDAWDTMASGIRKVYDSVIQPAFDALKNGLQKVQDFFGTVVDGITTVWDKLRSALAKPINFMIRTVYNNGILKAWNTVAKFIPGLDQASPLSEIPEHATGGAIRGPGTGTSDDVLMWGSNGEHMLTAREVDQLGGQEAVYAMRMMIDSGKSFSYDGQGGLIALPNKQDNTVGDLASAAPGLFPAFAEGGEIRPAWELKVERGHRFAQSIAPGPYILGGSSSQGSTDCSGYMSEIADVILGGPGGTRQWGTGSFPGPQAGAWAPGLSQGFSVGIMHGGAAMGHTAGTLSGAGPFSSVNVESGGGTGQGATYGGAAVGADHPQFTEQHHLKIGADGDFESAGGPSPAQKKSMLRDKVKDIFDNLLDPIDGMFASSVGTPPPEWFNIPPKAMHGSKDKVIDFIFDTIENLGELLGRAYDKAKDLGSAIVDGAKDAAGAVWDNTLGRLFANGGINEDHRAQIARGGDLRVWAEPETRGEAYIPFAMSKRNRSTEVLGQVAQRFGYDLVDRSTGYGYEVKGTDVTGGTFFADGGIRTPDEMLDFAKGESVDGVKASRSLQGAPYAWGGSDWGDCSGAMSQLAAFMIGDENPLTRKFSTADQGQWLAAHGFSTGKGGDGDLTIGWNGEHTSGMLPDGTLVEMSNPEDGGFIGSGAQALDSAGYTDFAHIAAKAVADSMPDTADTSDASPTSQAAEAQTVDPTQADPASPEEALAYGQAVGASVFAGEMGSKSVLELGTGAVFEFFGMGDSLTAKLLTTPLDDLAPVPDWYGHTTDQVANPATDTTVAETPAVATADLVDAATEATVEVKTTPEWGPDFFVHEIARQAKDLDLGAAGAKIGVATALVESGDPMQMFANNAIPESLQYRHDAVGSDSDSIGLFQQRDFNPPWGTVADRMDPYQSAGSFFNVMLEKFPGWQTMDPGAVAQGVQVSAFPDRYNTKMGRAGELITSAGIFDTGGILPDGGLAVNLSGKPEHVFTDQAMQDFVESSQALRDAADHLSTAAEAIAPGTVIPDFTGPAVEAPGAAQSDDAGQITLVINLDGHQVLEKRVDTVEGRVEVNEKDIREIKGARRAVNAGVKLLA